jgi:hypothetical protein
MTDRVRLTGAEVKAMWMSEDAIRMVDGTEYACTFAEHAQAVSS